MNGDATFERDLRAMLAARDPGPAPAGLAAAVRARLAADRELRRSVAIERVAGAAAVMAILAAVLILAIVVARPIAVGPGATQDPGPSAPYELKAGDGVVAGTHDPVLQALAMLLAFVGLLVLAATTVARRPRIAATIGCLAIAWTGLNIGTSDAVGFVSGVSGIEHGRVGPAAEGDLSALFVDATGDSAFTMYLTVTNTSRLSLELEGLAAPRPLVPDIVVPPRFVGVAILADASVDLSTEPRVPFEPVTLAPGGSIDLAVLGMAGQCAISPQDLSRTGRTWLDRIEIVYEQLTIWHTASIELPDRIYIAEPDACP